MWNAWIAGSRSDSGNFVLTGLRIGFPFSILQKSNEWETGVLNTHVSIETLFPEGLQFEGEPIDLSEFVKAQ